MQNSNKLSRGTLANIILFGFMGQVAWAVENNYFNTFLFNVIGGDANDISRMVSASSIIAVVATFLMGTLSDKINKRKIFVSAGYIAWGITVMAFAFISRENIGNLLGIDAVSALTATVSVVIIMDCVMTFMGSTSNDAAFNAWVTDVTSNENRAKTEGILSMCPIFAMVIVTVAFGACASSFGYPACFIGLGALVSVCGIVGCFTIKDSRNGIKQEGNYWANLIYGFRPSVVKANKGLYLSLCVLGIFSIATQVFFPYLFIYVQHYIGLDLNNLNITPAFIAIAAIVVVGVVVGAIYMGSLMDKKGRSVFSVPCILLLIVGLVSVFFAKNLIQFGVCAVIFGAGYGLMGILTLAAVRDFTPEDKAGGFQGVRMIFGVMLPMIIGPAIGAFVTDKFAVMTYTNDYAEIVNVPPPHIYIAAAIVAVFAFIPLIPLYKVWKEIEINRKNS